MKKKERNYYKKSTSWGKTHNHLEKMKIKNALTATATCGLTTIGLLASSQPAASQLTPQGWGSVGVEDSEISYSIGVRWFDFGVEVGTREDGATGVDVLKFISLPLLSPYVGVGFYSEEEEDVSVSGGLQIRPSGNVFFGVGYHSVRGVNGQIGLKL